MDESYWKVDLGHGIGPLVLGDSRKAVLARLKQENLEVEFDDDDDPWAVVPDLEMQLNFSDDDPPRLVEIEVEDERLRFGSLPVLGERVHSIVELLQVPENETLWRSGYDPSHMPPDPEEEEEVPSRPATDEELLDEGTLWITTLGLGLVLWRGEVLAVRLRMPQDSPQRGSGPFLPRHAELSRDPGLREKLTKPWTLPAPRRRSLPRKLLGYALIAALGLTLWQAFRYQQRWNTAPRVEGQIIAVKPPPPDPFPTEFTVAYQDQKGGSHQVVFDLANVNDGRHIGDKVELRYLADEPDQAMGVASSRDAAMIKFLPWGIGVIVAFVVLQFVVAFVPWPKRST